MPAALVGTLGSGPLAAVGLSSALFNFSNFLFSFLMVVTTPKVASAVARSKLDEVRSIPAMSACLLDHSLNCGALTLLTWSDSIVLFSPYVQVYKKCPALVLRGVSCNHVCLMMQASQTTAQGLWLAGVCGVVVGLAIWFGGPFAVTGIQHHTTLWLFLYGLNMRDALRMLSQT